MEQLILLDGLVAYAVGIAENNYMLKEKKWKIVINITFALKGVMMSILDTGDPYTSSSRYSISPGTDGSTTTVTDNLTGLKHSFTTSSTISTNSLFPNCGLSLTTEETDELSALMKERDVQIKLEAKSMFRNLPTTIIDKIYDKLACFQAAKEISELRHALSKPSRLQELEAKRDSVWNLNYNNGLHVYPTTTTTNPSLLNSFYDYKQPNNSYSSVPSTHIDILINLYREHMLDTEMIEICAERFLEKHIEKKE